MTPQLQRALRMALYMEGIPDEQFDIRLWITRLDGVDIHTGKMTHGCGTVCCFIGHLPFCFPEDFRHDIRDTCVVSMDGAQGPEASASFFGLSENQLAKVIYASYYDDGSPTKSIVVGRFLDRIKWAHGIEDMDAALRLMRERIKEERKEDATVHKAPVQ